MPMMKLWTKVAECTTVCSKILVGSFYTIMVRQLLLIHDLFITFYNVMVVEMNW